MRGFLDWLDHRTGYREILSHLLLEKIPGGAKWRYVWGSCLAFVFLLQVVTGILLMTSYSPSDGSAWASVYFIQYQMDFGWLIRGLHHFGSQTMVVLLALHMLQVVIAGAHLPPREVNWWLGLGLLAVVLGLSLTGYLLPWDQKGYWATQVATNIAGALPGLGPFLQKIIVGGPAYGHQTLTHFFALHVGVLPALLVILLIAHIAVFRRHGIKYAEEEKNDRTDYFFPAQVFKDLVACMAVFAVMLFLVINGHGHKVEGGVSADADLYTQWAQAGKNGLGANLDAPADPAREYPARPEWYFLFLFQLLKYFEGDYFLVGTVIIPNAVGLLLFVLPLFGFGKMKKFGHVLGVVVVTALLAILAALTCLALADDALDPFARALLIRVGTGIIPLIAGLFLIYLGVLALLKRSPLKTGVFAVGGALLLLLSTATCGLMYASLTNTEQLPGLVADFFKGKMRPEEKLTAAEVDAEVKKFEAEVQRVAEKISDADKIAKIPEATTKEKIAAEKKKLQTQFDARIPPATQKWGVGVLKFTGDLAIATKEAERAVQVAGDGIPAQGSVVLLRNDPKTQFKGVFTRNCASCHSYGEFGGAAWKTTDIDAFKTAKFTASDLAGFGTKDWIHAFLLDPGGERFYGRSKVESKDEAGKPVKDPQGKPALEPRFTSMANFVVKQKKRHKDAVSSDFAKIAEWLAIHPEGDKWDRTPHAAAYQLFTDKYNCISCHKYGSEGPDANSAPDLTNYGSQDWLRRMIRSPDHPYLYGGKNAMPSFRDLDGLTSRSDKEEYAKLVGKKVEDLRFANLVDIDREVLIRHLTRDDRVIFGGLPLTGPKREK